MGKTRIDTHQFEPGAAGSILVTNDSSEPEWQASGASSGDTISFNGSAWVASPDNSITSDDAVRLMVFFGRR